MLALTALGSGSLAGQGAVLSGRVVYARGRSVAVVGGRAVLHEVSMTRQAAIDSTRTDAAGRYRFRLANPDTGALYLVSSMRDGIVYFTQPLRAAPGHTVAVDSLLVYDTSSTGSPIRVERLLVTIAKARSDGSRDVLHVLELRNPDLTTRIAPDTVRPTWRGLLPSGVLQFQVGESDFSPQAVSRRGDSVLVFGPVQPGVARQLTFTYTIPADRREVVLPVDQAVGQAHVLFEDTAATLDASRPMTRSPELVDGRPFARYSSAALPAGTSLVVHLPSDRAAPERFVPWLVGGMIAALLLGLTVALRRRIPA